MNEATDRQFFPEVPFFLGRDNSVLTLRQLFNSKRIITINGMGGIGKTSLSYKFLNQYGSDFRIIAISLEGEITHTEFISEIALELNIPTAKISFNDLLKSIIRVLRKSTRILFFIDNFDIIADKRTEDNMKIISFLKTLPVSVRILLTSRRNKNLDDEYVYRLDGLNEIHASSLFIKYAADKIPSKPTNEFMRLVKSLSKKCYGHPLMIKILSKNYQGKGISEISNLDNRLEAFDTDEPEERFKNIMKCFDYTFEKLDEFEIKIIQSLLLFCSPFSKVIIKEVFGDVISAFNGIYDRGLVERYDPSIHALKTENVFYYFHSLVREYINKKFGKYSINIKYYRSYMLYYLTAIDNYQKIGRDKGLFNLYTFNQILKYNPNDFENAISLLKDLPTKSFYLNKFGSILGNLQFHEHAKRVFDKGLKVDLEWGDKQRIANDYKKLGDSFIISDFEKSLNHYLESLKLNKNNVEEKIHIHMSISKLFLINDKFEDAHNSNLDLLKELKIIFKEQPNRLNEFFYWYCDHMAYYYKYTNNNYKMLGFGLACVTINRQITNNNRGFSYQLINDILTVSLAYKRLGRYYDALEYAREGFDLSNKHQYVQGMLLACRRFTYVYQALNEINLSFFYSDLRRKLKADL